MNRFSVSQVKGTNKIIQVVQKRVQTLYGLPDNTLPQSSKNAVGIIMVHGKTINGREGGRVVINGREGGRVVMQQNQDILPFWYKPRIKNDIYNVRNKWVYV